MAGAEPGTAQRPPPRGHEEQHRPAPLAGRGQALPLSDTRAGSGPGWRFSLKQLLTHASLQVVPVVPLTTGSRFVLLRLRVRSPGALPGASWECNRRAG